MQIGNIAARLIKPFAKSGSKATIPLNQTDATRASYDQGFPPLNMTPIAAGGVPPSGQDMNGILYALSNAMQWQQAMGILPWDSAYAENADIAGYPNGALVQHSGAIWRSKANNNAVAPSAASAAWERVSAEGGTTGQALVKASNKNGDWTWKALAIYGLFYKADPTTVAFTKTGAGTASIKAGTKVDVAGTVVTFVAATAITMPTLTAGTDYAIWVKDDATIQATANFSSAPSAGNWRKIGGFHYAPGGLATGTSGGDTTPAINVYSFWDLKFRPACPDPRGMTLVADSFWSDIYLLGVDHLTNGTSKYNVTIADGSSPPKIPTKFGGNGTSAYASMNWWEANEVLKSWGKRSPTYEEFAALAYGTTEASSVGTDQGSTVLNAAYTSKWGCVQSSGCMWVWGGEFGGGAAASWTANTGGRGSTFQMENAVLFGGYWDDTSYAGSRASYWGDSPTFSSYNVGARGVANHLILD